MATNRIEKSQAKRLLREAAGYLELATQWDDFGPQPETYRRQFGARALSLLDRLPATFAARPTPELLRGQALRLLGRWQEAIAPLRRAAFLKPHRIDAWVAIGWCYKRAGQLPQAIAALRRACQVAPRSAVCHYNLACYCSLANMPNLAIRHLAVAVRLSPELRKPAASEEDFDPIRSHPEFDSMIDGVKG
jgi:tetratricopeptide (TPR) repeat protein